MIIGRRRWVLLTQRPIDPADGLLQLVGVVVAARRRRLSSASMIGRLISSKTESSSAKPRAWISGPPATLPVTESTTTMTEMKPSSPRIRRSLREDSVMSPTDEPSTKT